METLQIFTKEAAKMRDKVNDYFFCAETVMDFMRDNKEVKKIIWMQYTPYFDGSEKCYFSVGEPHFIFNNDDDYDEENGHFLYAEEYERGRYKNLCSKETFDNCLALGKTLGELEIELKNCFGDHAKITVTRAGVDVEEFEHE